MIVKRLIMLVLLIVVFLVSACGTDSLLKKEYKDTMRTVIDAKGNKVLVPSKPKRIVSLTLGTDELVLDLVEAERVLAVTSLADDEGISHVVDKSKSIHNKIKGVPSAEQIIALEPDLVLIADWWSLNILDSLREMKVPVYVYKTPYNVEEIKASVRELAGVLGAEQRGQEIIGEMSKDLKNTQNYLANKRTTGNKRILVLSNHGIIGTRGSLFADMCRIARVENTLADLNISQGNTVSKEMILKHNPDMLLLTSWSNGGMQGPSELKEMLADESLQTVAAVKNKAIVPISGRTVYCISHHVTKEIQNLAKIVYDKE